MLLFRLSSRFNHSRSFLVLTLTDSSRASRCLLTVHTCHTVPGACRFGSWHGWETDTPNEGTSPIIRLRTITTLICTGPGFYKYC